MAHKPILYGKAAEAMIVGLARSGDREAFAELVRRRQSWIRNLMRRFCHDDHLADDLAQQVFLQAWRHIRSLQQSDRFGAWLRRLAVNTWLQHRRANDPIRNADELDETHVAAEGPAGMAFDLDRALASLPEAPRLCIVLSYNEGMTHEEIAELTELPAGTVKSHIRRGAERLRQILTDYNDGARNHGQ
ncbi:sigma-70 family RNA polymerase sigma factor [Hoeflea sp. WL0058]|uniref:Sigma-70 family RNA polymerase sigma factor n=1 Tax=Flavimaribacter sediminis TaxID=2865987 RepID=A0AAE3CYL1_9HYPH|nr:sigma-70 family RNA polymerase sigma factor [Flavimaribacter sediminis]MBW8635769.1 sigma-70 family RNA polymerase sigma factor [Flavimaribacter sediminis]